MNKVAQSMFLVIALAVSACAPTVTSSKLSEASRPPWQGAVLITPLKVPEEVTYEIIGKLKVQAQKGYGGARNLYPLLADEARKLGANAVIDAQGGRRVVGWSWAAPYASGTAIYVQDSERLKSLTGEFH